MTALRKCASCCTPQELLNAVKRLSGELKRNECSGTDSGNRKTYLVSCSETAKKLVKLAKNDQKRCKEITKLKETGFPDIKQKNQQLFCGFGSERGQGVLCAGSRKHVATCGQSRPLYLWARDDSTEADMVW